MHLVEEKPDFEYFLRQADGHKAQVAEHVLHASFILSPRQLIENWPPGRLEEIDLAALQPIFALAPEVIILGCGEHQGFPAAEVMAACLGRGIGIECMNNPAAARTFNVLAGEGRKVVAAFVLSGQQP